MTQHPTKCTICTSPGASMEITACHNYFDNKTVSSLSFLTWMNKLLMLLFKLLLLLLLSHFSSDSVQPHRRQPTRLLRPWDFPGTSTGVGCHCLLQLFKLNPINSFTPLQKWGHLVVMVILLKCEVYPCRT